MRVGTDETTSKDTEQQRLLGSSEGDVGRARVSGAGCCGPLMLLVTALVVTALWLLLSRVFFEFSNPCSGGSVLTWPWNMVTPLPLAVRNSSALDGSVGEAPESKPACQCEAFNSSWVRPTRAEGSRPRCIFIDLGANNGDTYNFFLHDSRRGVTPDSKENVRVANYAFSDKEQVAADGSSLNEFHFRIGPEAQNASECDIFMVEANGQFSGPLSELKASHTGSGEVHVMCPNAVYMCSSHPAIFYDDVVLSEHDYWDSGLKARSDLWQRIYHWNGDGRACYGPYGAQVGGALLDPGFNVSNGSEVLASGYVEKKPYYAAREVPTVNLIQLLYEHALPEDFVVIESDIEGAEWDILPCLSSSPAAGLIDEIFVEVHPQDWGLLGTTDEEFDEAVAKLRKAGVRFPVYNSDV